MVIVSRSLNPMISVIIPHLNQPDCLEACLHSLEVQTLKRSNFEVIVVDNGSSRGPEAQISRYRGVRLLREPEPGPGPARNCGAKAATGDILCFIDADCRAHPEWLDVVHFKLNSLPQGTILGGDVQIWRDNKKYFTAIEAYESVFGYRQKMHIERFGFSGSGNLAVRRTDFEKVGPFKGITLAEDVDWGNRAQMAGLRFVYVPQMIVYHPARASLQHLCIQWDRLIQHTLTAARQKSRWKIYWILRAIAVFGSSFAHIPEVTTSRHIKGLATRIKAFYILVVIRSYRAWKMITLLRCPDQGVVWNRDAAVGAAKPE
jgi:GT2 family glycosyltransferase